MYHKAIDLILVSSIVSHLKEKKERFNTIWLKNGGDSLVYKGYWDTLP